MPELPEVETVCRGLNQLTIKQPIENGQILLERTLAYPSSKEEFSQNIKGKQILFWKRRGKYLLAHLTNSEQQPEGLLGVHLRMTGQLLWTKQTEALQKHTRVRLFFPKNQELRFIDTRTFGKIWLLPPKTPPENIITGLQKLGPEPFGADFSIAYFSAKLKKRRRNIKTLLLDQEIVAGIGNIYADESLFKSGILPQTIATDLSPKQITELHKAILDVLKEGISKGGTSFSDFLNLLGVNGNYGNFAWVYGRKDKPCRVCSTPIKKIKLGGRSSHFCPNCQQ